MNYIVVIPAAGQGKRMNVNKNKQFLLLDGKPIIIHTLETFEGDIWCKEIIVVANKNEVDEMSELFKTFKITKVKKIVIGGLERQQSVYNGLKTIDTDEIVLIHDGARPFVKIAHIHQLVEEATKSGGAILAVPVKDTIKACEGNRVANTLDRSYLWSIQTPQAFHSSEILMAHQWAEENRFLGTDDASLMEKLNKTVKTVVGDYFNIKITTQEDIVFAEAILKVKKGVK